MRYLSNFFLILVVAILISACSITDRSSRQELADNFAKQHQFEKKLVIGGPFWFTSYQRITSPQDKNYVIYLEGDGLVMEKRNKISENPTPSSIMLLELAAIDRRPNIVYLARPCQYTPMNMNPTCNQSYWLDKRMSQDSILAISQAINNITSGNKYDLIGFSGGGGIAILIAAHSKNVKSIITIAGNLNHVALHKHHHVHQTPESLNPIDYSNQVSNIPQLHLSGGQDRVVPPFIADDFIKSVNNKKCIQREIIPNATHTKKWNKSWEYILSKPLSCI